MLDSLIAFLAQYFYIIVLALGILLLIVLYRPRLPELVIAALLIGGFSYILSKIGTQLIVSPRPFVVSGHAALIQSATDNGFPSDHTLLLAVLSAVISLVSWRWGLASWALALLVGLARVYAGVHHIIDVAGSILIVILATVLYLLLRRLWRSWRHGHT